MSLRVAVLGARRKVLGTGPFVARFFHEQGCEVVGILGTSERSVETARAELDERWGFRPPGFTSLPRLLDEARPDLVAICTPTGVHRAQLRECLAAGVNVLCEKPLWWDETCEPGAGASLQAELDELVGGFVAAGRLLTVNAQWPRTLESFYALHPEQRGAPLNRFEMRLSPIATGVTSVIDSAPHLLSLLQALVGVGELSAISARWEDAEQGRLVLGFDYEAGGRETAVTFRQVRTTRPPRPAWYAINGARAERTIELSDYSMRFVAGERGVDLPDPLEQHIAATVKDVVDGRRTDATAIIAAQRQLVQLVDAVRACAKKSFP